MLGSGCSWHFLNKVSDPSTAPTDLWCLLYWSSHCYYQCCGSESEIIRIFWLDPNPQKSSDSDTDSESDSDTVEGWNFCEKSKIKHLKEKNLLFCFLLNIFFLWRTGFRTHTLWKQLETTFRKIWGQKISLRIRIRKKIICGSEYEKNEFRSTTLATTATATTTTGATTDL
jgi:hypothetical protein